MVSQCPECDSIVVAGRCKACGWTAAEESKAHKKEPIKCCLCKGIVDMQGWCDNCGQYPINVTPVRECPDCGGHTDTGGLCRRCNACTRTRLEPDKGCWSDTGIVAKLLSREENARRWRDLVTMMESSDPSGAMIEHCKTMQEREPGIGWDKAARDIAEYHKVEWERRVLRKHQRRETRRRLEE